METTTAATPHIPTTPPAEMLAVTLSREEALHLLEMLTLSRHTDADPLIVRLAQLYRAFDR